MGILPLNNLAVMHKDKFSCFFYSLQDVNYVKMAGVEIHWNIVNREVVTLISK